MTRVNLELPFVVMHMLMNMQMLECCHSECLSLNIAVQASFPMTRSRDLLRKLHVFINWAST